MLLMKKILFLKFHFRPPQIVLYIVHHLLAFILHTNVHCILGKRGSKFGWFMIRLCAKLSSNMQKSDIKWKKNKIFTNTISTFETYLLQNALVSLISQKKWHEEKKKKYCSLVQKSKWSESVPPPNLKHLDSGIKVEVGSFHLKTKPGLA